MFPLSFHAFLPPPFSRPRSRRWNTWLQQRELQVDDLCEDVKPGAMCVNLIEVLSGSLAGKHHATPKTKYQMLENQGVFLDMLRSKGIRLVNIGNEDLVEGNRTLILGLTWTLILRYEIQKYGADENELLRWVRACTKGYKEVKITSWGDSFNDGLAFCALIHKHAPEELDYPGLDKGAEFDAVSADLRKAWKRIEMAEKGLSSEQIDAYNGAGLVSSADGACSAHVPHWIRTALARRSPSGSHAVCAHVSRAVG